MQILNKQKRILIWINKLDNNNNNKDLNKNNNNNNRVFHWEEED